ncbi:MAG: MerR family transcriptional regulator [Thermodesulfobacteriota bacterium]
MPPEIPDKVYFKIGEVAEIVGVETHVLRFWETEFPQVRPVRAGSRQRLYRRQDLLLFLEIKRLLYEKKFTIAGAKKELSQAGKVQDRPAAAPDQEVLRQVKEGLREIKKLLKD